MYREGEDWGTIKTWAVIKPKVVEIGIVWAWRQDRQTKPGVCSTAKNMEFFHSTLSKIQVI